MKNPKNFHNAKRAKAPSGKTNMKTPYTGKLESTNSSKRKNMTDYRPQPK